MTSDAGAVDAVTRGQVAEVRKALGRQLRACRKAAGLTQVQLAACISYSRSSVACAEAGRQIMARAFWERADRATGARRAVLAAFDDLERLAQVHREQTARALDEQRTGYASGGCGCGVVVGRWTERESRALREALRMSMRAFAEHLGVSTATVSAWESQATTAPLRLASQAVLDRALTLAGADVRTRFALLLIHSAPHGASGAAGGSVVTLHRPDRERVAS
jgi:DNA-binding transcriptional regulator YiaG